MFSRSLFHRVENRPMAGEPGEPGGRHKAALEALKVCNLWKRFRYGHTRRVRGGRAVLLNPPPRGISFPLKPPILLPRPSLSVCTSIPAPLSRPWTSQRGARSCSPASPCSQRSIWTRSIPATTWRPAAPRTRSTIKTRAKQVSAGVVYFRWFD